MPQPAAPRSRRSLAHLALLALPCVGVTLGCARSPMEDAAARSPYERYDDLRGRGVPRTTVDSFGRERLNLEGRLGDAGSGG